MPLLGVCNQRALVLKDLRNRNCWNYEKGEEEEFTGTLVCFLVKILILDDIFSLR